jgi:hypothetical protein
LRTFRLIFLNLIFSAKSGFLFDETCYIHFFDSLPSIVGEFRFYQEPVNAGFKCYFELIASLFNGIEGAELRFFRIARQASFPRMPLLHSEDPGMVFGGFKERQ